MKRKVLGLLLSGMIILVGIVLESVADSTDRAQAKSTDNVSVKETTAKASTEEHIKKTVIKDVSNVKSGIKLKWKKIKDASGYIIWRDNKKLTVIKNNKTIYTDKTAKTNGKKYYYRIESYKKSGNKTVKSGPSKKRGQYYLNGNRFDVIYMKGNTVYSKWTANVKAGGYEILYAKKSDFSDAVTLTVSGKNNTGKNITLSNKSNYYFKIRNYRVTGKDNKKRTCYSPWSRVCTVINWNSSKEFAGNSVLHTDAVTLYRSYAAHRVKKVVCVNAGHGTVGGNSVKTLCHPDGSRKVTGGSTAAGETKAAAVSSGTVLKNGVTEADANLSLAKILKDKLLAAGFDVLMIRDDKNVNIDNIARTVFANEYADYHISLHYDSSENDKGAFYIGVPQISSYLNMYPVSENYQKHKSLGENVLKGMREAGVKIYGSGCMALDLTQTSYSKIASIDIEVGDRASDTSYSTLEKIAEGILKGIKHEAGI